MRKFGDARGFFTERFRLDQFTEAGIPAAEFMQDNYSRSEQNVLRGLHYQYDRPQAKLVTATVGRILDVIVDIRAQSPTFGQSLSVELDGDSPAWLWVPIGFAHGFVVLSPTADIMYKVNAPYNPQGEGGIAWNDPSIKIAWPTVQPLLSGRDLTQGSFADYKKAPRF